jgi:hypothetical protein
VLQKSGTIKSKAVASTQLFRAGENPSTKKKSKLVLNSIFLEWLRTKVLSTFLRHTRKNVTGSKGFPLLQKKQ